MKLLIKLGGALLDAPDSRHGLAREISAIIAAGHQVVVVHGGGKQMTRYLTRQGIESRFVNGLRVTTPEILDAVLKVFAGSVNHELVAAFITCGTPAVGLSGMDALVTEARQMSEELGAVGKPVRSDARLLHLLLGGGFLPVIACLAGDANGRFFNVNADQMAVSIAGALGADRLFFLTDVEGVKNEENKVYSALNLEQCRQLIDKGVATGGMRAKLESAIEALDTGVSEVAIAPGAHAGILVKLLAGDPIGTRLFSPTAVYPNA